MTKVKAGEWLPGAEFHDAVMEQVFPHPGSFCHCGCDPRHHEVVDSPYSPGPVVRCKEHRRYFNPSGCAQLPPSREMPPSYPVILQRLFERWSKL